MLKDYLVQRHISLESGRSSIALEREYWKALETLAYDDGWHNWRDFFYVNVLPDKPDDMPLASHVRKTITTCLFVEYGKSRAA
jgi:predicted DNA-binding ribbon-helix-helix protein